MPLPSCTAPAFAQDKPKLLAIDGFMFKGVFTELDPEQMKRRLSLAEIDRLHFDGKSTAIEEILKLMATVREAARPGRRAARGARRDPRHAAAQHDGQRGVHDVLLCVQSQRIDRGRQRRSLVLIRPETRPEAPRLERTWNREQILPIRLFRLGYLRSDLILAQYQDKLGTRAGRAILEAKSNVVIVADKAASLEKLARYIDAEALQSMGVPAAAGHTAAEGLRPPSLGAIASPCQHSLLSDDIRPRQPDRHRAARRRRRSSTSTTPKPTSGSASEAIARSRPNTTESTNTSSSPARPAARAGPCPTTSAPFRLPSRTGSRSTSASSPLTPTVPRPRK